VEPHLSTVDQNSIEIEEDGPHETAYFHEKNVPLNLVPRPA
jgi:hypothetical protein